MDIVTTDVSGMPGDKPATVQVRLEAFVCPLNGAPGPTEIELAVVDYDGCVNPVVLTPGLARSLAAVLRDMIQQADG